MIVWNNSGQGRSPDTTIPGYTKQTSVKRTIEMKRQ